MYRISEFSPGTYGANQVIAHHYFIDTVWFPTNLANSRARSLVAAIGQTIFIVQRNGVQIATMTFAAAASVATFANMAAAIDFVDGNYLTIVAPAIPDGTLAGVSVTLFGERHL